MTFVRAGLRGIATGWLIAMMALMALFAYTVPCNGDASKVTREAPRPTPAFRRSTSRRIISSWLAIHRRRVAGNGAEHLRLSIHSSSVNQNRAHLLNPAFHSSSITSKMSIVFY